MISRKRLYETPVITLRIFTGESSTVKWLDELNNLRDALASRLISLSRLILSHWMDKIAKKIIFSRHVMGYHEFDR